LPLFEPYEIVRMQDSFSKMSSSKGKSLALKSLLDIFPAKLIMWLYLKKRNMSQIVFDFRRKYFRYFKEYDAFVERIRSGTADSVDLDISRLIEFDGRDGHDAIDMKHLCFVAQAFSFNENAVLSYFNGGSGYASERLSPPNLSERLGYVRRWLLSYAPAKYYFKLRKPMFIQERHGRAAAFIIDCTLSSRVERAFDDYVSIYEVLFDRGWGPKFSSIIRYWNLAEIYSHCMTIVAERAKSAFSSDSLRSVEAGRLLQAADNLCA
jgi:lysyl-tRNA synthetase class I